MTNYFEHGRLDEGGRIVIPSAYRKALGVKPGDRVVLELLGNEIRLLSFRENVRRLQDEVLARIPGERSLADELIAERRIEAARE